MSTAPAGTGRIGRDDIEAKFRELQSDVDDTVEQSMGIAVIAGAAVLVGLVVVAFALGRRRGRKRTTVVEVRRI